MNAYDGKHKHLSLTTNCSTVNKKVLVFSVES